MPPLVSLVLILLALALLLCVGVVVGMALMLLRPPRMTDGKATYVLRRLSPADVGLKFEAVRFGARDEPAGREIGIAGWWIPHPHALGRCVVLVHGYGDAKVGAIAWAPTLHALGFSVLAVDLRAHGESGGQNVTAGYFERDDLDAVINQIRAARPAETRTIVLFGISLGAAVVAATAARRDDVAAVVMESPYADYRNAVRAHAEILGQPGGFLLPIGMRLAEWISGADFRAVRPVDLVPQISCPLMIIQAGDDPFVPPEDAKRLEAAVASRPAELLTTYWHIPDAPHVQGLGLDPVVYRQRLETFLEQATAPVLTEVR